MWKSFHSPGLNYENLRHTQWFTTCNKNISMCLIFFDDYKDFPTTIICWITVNLLICVVIVPSKLCGAVATWRKSLLPHWRHSLEEEGAACSQAPPTLAASHRSRRQRHRIWFLRYWKKIWTTSYRTSSKVGKCCVYLSSQRKQEPPCHMSTQDTLFKLYSLDCHMLIVWLSHGNHMIVAFFD